jgi:AraC-like DNA-binding protein
VRSEGRGIAAARQRSIMADISANFDHDDLSVADVARRHHVTPRYIHKLFENEGLTFSSFVLGQRLSRAHRIRSDPRFADRNIGSVAFDVEFGDLSYFNRSFRRRYAATPTDIKQSSMRPNRVSTRRDRRCYQCSCERPSAPKGAFVLLFRRRLVSTSSSPCRRAQHAAEIGLDQHRLCRKPWTCPPVSSCGVRLGKSRLPMGPNRLSLRLRHCRWLPTRR